MDWDTRMIQYRHPARLRMTIQTTNPNPLNAFQWAPQPQTQKLVRELVADFLSRNAFAAELARRMKDESGTRFYDWVEAVLLPASSALEEKMRAVGYEKSRDGSGWINPHGMFPRLVPQTGSITAIHLKVGSVTEFADVWR